MSQVEETSYTYAQYRNTFRNRQQFRDVRYILADSNGTHFEYQDALGERRFGVISDLSSFSISRVGRVQNTLGVGIVTATFTDAISPALNDSVLANWRTSVSLQNPLGTLLVSVFSSLVSTTSISLKIVRASNNVAVNTTGISVDGQDLIDVDVITLNPHGSDAGVGPHGHTLAGGGLPHPVTDPGHLHGPGVLASVLYTVDWMIVHK